MAGKIYVIAEDGGLRALDERPYSQEARLQELLAEFPDLLAGEQMNELSPRRWLLVSRELGVPLEEGGGDAMSLDHLFLDQDAIPTLVEVKRSSDTRIRREVVGQMLDYASHAVAYWTAEQLRSRFERACEQRGEDPVTLVSELIESDANGAALEEYWGQVKTNLQAGRIRLLFVADEFGPEVRRVIEFLNRYMDPVEVLGVEVKQFVGQGLSTLVPRVLGQTAQAEAKKAHPAARGEPWDEPRFFAQMEAERVPEDVWVARRTLAWTRERGLGISWGRGTLFGSFTPVVEHGGGRLHFFTVWTSGAVQVNFAYLKSKPPFESCERRLEVLAHLNAIERIALRENEIERMPNIPLSVLHDESRLVQFLDVFEEMLVRIRGA